MSAHQVRKILLRAQTDDEFYQLFRSDPDAALAEYSLTVEERDALVRGDPSLYLYLIPTVSTISKDRIGIEFVITITGEHDWINVFGAEEPPAITAETRQDIVQLAERVLETEGAERVELLVTLLQLLDRRR